MKTKFAALLAAVLAVNVVVNPIAKAISFEINIGDRPYYEGPSYWDDGYLWVWVPGFWYRDRWIHGHYERRGEWRREYEHERHEHHEHHDHDHHDHDHHDHH